MPATQAPYSQYFDKNGQPLDAGYVWFGLPNENPKTSPVNVYWDADLTQPASQPIRTLAGYLARNGSPAQVFTDGAYSQIVENKRFEMVYYAANSADYSDLPIRVAVITATDGQTLVNLPFAYTRGNNSLAIYLNGILLIKDRDYTETSTTSVTMIRPLKVGPGGADEVTAIGGRLINAASAIDAVSAAALAAGSGAGLVGYDPSLTFPAGTVGERLQQTTWTVPAIDDVDATAFGGDCVVVAEGRSAAGDGGGGTFRYVADSTQATDEGVVFAPTAGGGRLLRDGIFLESETGVGFNGPLNARWFGAKGDAVTNDTQALQDWLDACKLYSAAAYCPRGKYLFDQIAVPNLPEFYGDGIGGYGSVSPTYVYDGTVFMQRFGVEDDAIVLDVPLEGSFYRCFHANWHDFIVLRQFSSGTVGNGISFRQVGTDRAVTANHALLNGVATFRRILVRGFPENGMYCRQGASPAYFDDLDFIFNGGYGLRIDGTNYVRGIVMRNIAGDGNSGRAVVRVGASSTDNNLLIDGLFAEYRSDSPYGNTSGFPGAQPDALELVDFGANSVVIVQGINAQSIVTNEAMRSGVFLNTTSSANTPRVEAFGVMLQVTGLAGGIKASLYDNRLSLTICPNTISTFVYDLNASAAVASATKWTVFGGGSFSAVTPYTSGVQVKGDTPGWSTVETDAGADAKHWTEGPSGGNYLWRTLDDAGSTSNSYMQAIRSGGAVTRIEMLKELRTTAALRVQGDVGFYNFSPIPRQTGVAVTAAAIHAALVNLGLIGA